MYKVGIISEVHGTVPLVVPLYLENPSPVPDPLLLTWNPFFACGAIPVHPVPGCLCTDLPPPFFLPVPLFPFPNGSPF